MAETADLREVSGPAEALSTDSLSYGQLVRRRFRRNAYGMTGLAMCIFVILTAIFAGFIAPYSPTKTNSAALYSPPQWVRIIAPEG